jgi:hypothetical protein
MDGQRGEFARRQGLHEWLKKSDDGVGFPFGIAHLVERLSAERVVLGGKQARIPVGVAQDNRDVKSRLLVGDEVDGQESGGIAVTFVPGLNRAWSSIVGCQHIVHSPGEPFDKILSDCTDFTLKSATPDIMPLS